MPYEYKPGNNDPLSREGRIVLAIVALSFFVWLMWIIR